MEGRKHNMVATVACCTVQIFGQGSKSKIDGAALRHTLFPNVCTFWIVCQGQRKGHSLQRYGAFGGNSWMLCPCHFVTVQL